MLHDVLKIARRRKIKNERVTLVLDKDTQFTKRCAMQGFLRNSIILIMDVWAQVSYFQSRPGGVGHFMREAELGLSGGSFVVAEFKNPLKFS